MKFISEKTGKEFELGNLVDFDDRTYDMTVITKWDNTYEQGPALVGYYFGEPKGAATEFYIEQFDKQQNTLSTAIELLEKFNKNGMIKEEEVNKLKTTIESLKQMIVTF